MDPSAPSFSTGYPLKDIPAPHPHDVLCGRGGGTNNHVGNSHWRMLVAANKQLYVTLPKRQKMLLSRSIVNAVRSQNPPGRFLQKDAKSDLWYDVGDQRAQEKTSQALREGAPDIRNKMKDPPGSDSKKSATTKATASAPPPAASAVSAPVAPVAPPPIPPPAPPIPPVPPAPISASAPPPTAVPTASSSGSSFPSTSGTPFVATAVDPTTAMLQQPVMVQVMTPNGLTTVPMYPAAPMMMQAANGTMPTAMMGMPGMAPVNGPAMPPPIPSQMPNQNKSKAAPSPAAPASAQPTGLTTSSSGQAMPPPNAVGSGASSSQPRTNSAMAQGSAHGASQNASEQQQTSAQYDDAAMPMGGLEPAGLSFGSVSMMSMGPSNRLEPAGTSFGTISVMDYSVSSKAVEMVDGGLEPIGTSFGSLSLTSHDKKDLARALEPDPIALNYKMKPPAANMAPPVFAAQRSRGNLLECSDTDESDDDEEAAPGAASKSAEWEKLQAMLANQTKPSGNSANNNVHVTFDIPPAPVGGAALPHTTFEHNFSELSALSMGEFSEVHDSDNEAEHNDRIAMPPPHLKKEDEAAKLEMMFLGRGSSLVYEEFGGEKKQQAAGQQR